MFTGDTGYERKYLSPTTQSRSCRTKKPRKHACWITHSLYNVQSCCYVQAQRGVCVCVKGCSLLESCQLSETTVGG